MIRVSRTRLAVFSTLILTALACFAFAKFVAFAKASVDPARQTLANTRTSETRDDFATPGDRTGRNTLARLFLDGSQGNSSSNLLTATTLAAGDVAIVTYNSDNPDAAHPDGFSFVLLRDIGSGTVINFTDKGWLSAGGFLSTAGDSTVTFTASSDLTAGTVIASHNASGVLNTQFSGALNLNNGASISGNDTASSDQIIAFQGTEASPTLLYAIDFGDGNTTFAANATNQNTSALPSGLTLGTTAVAISGDNGTYGGGATAKPANTAANLRADVSDSNSWVFNDNSPQTLLSGPFLKSPDHELWAAASGAGEAIARIDGDATVGGGTLGYDLVQALQNDANLFHPSDIALDTVHDKFFMIDADLAGHNRLVQGSISQILNNPGAAFTPIILYSNTDSNATNSMRTLSVDVQNKIIYIDIATTFNKVAYDTPGQTPTQLANLGSNNYITQATIDYTRGEVYLGSSKITSFFGTDGITKNYVYKATGLTSASSSLTFSQLPFNPDDAGLGPEGSPLSGEAWPVERGTVRGIDIDPVNHDLYISTGSVSLDNDGNGVTNYLGGVWKYDLDSNPTGNVTNIYQQNGTTGAVGLLYYIEVDPNTNRYYVIDETGDAGPDGGSVWTGSTTAAGTPTLFSRVDNINGLAPQGIELDTAPTLAITSANPTYTEQAGSPSPAGPGVALISAVTAGDFDTTTFTDQLAGATVRISGNFVSGDQLTFTNSGGVTGSYNASTGVLTFTGTSTFANYQTVLASVKFTNAGDNPTVYGANTSRTLAWSVSDGLLISDEQTTSVAVVGVNDAPVNSVPAAPTILEDTLTAIPSLSFSDVDADPANQTVTVALSVSNGTLTLNTGVASGIVAGDITGGANGSASVTVTASLNKINTTLTNVTGLRYKGVQDYFGAETLHIVTNDNGHTGTPGAMSDTDDMSLIITPVNDVPSFTKGVDQTVLEDAVAQTVNGWATSLSKGPANESAQTLSFIVSNNNNALFSIQPSVSATGVLSYTPAANANGTALVTVQIHDDGGTANGGADTSASQTFNINLTAVNDAPSFTKGADKTVNEDAGVQAFAGWATAISAGPANENAQTLNFIVSNDNNSLFSSQPVVASNGTLTFTPAANANGSTTVTISLHDNGGTANSGVDTSATQTFTINVTSVNDVPSFTKGADQTALAGSGAKTVAGWATSLSAGSADESGQTLHFNVSNDNNSLFSVQPAVDASGQLTYTPAAAVNGSATVTVAIQDNGGTANGGVDTSPSQTFIIGVTNTATWTGAVSSDWNVPGNWSLASVPVASNSVMVPNSGVANEPLLGGATDVTLLDLTVGSGRSLTVDNGRTLTITGTLNMAGNDIDATNGLLAISATGSVTRTSGSVVGTVNKLYAGPGSFTYPVGTAGGGFSPVVVTVTAGSGHLSIKANNGTVPAIPALDATKMLQRYWTLNGSGVTSNVVFHYLDTDVPVTSAENEYRVFRVLGDGTALGFQPDGTNVLLDTGANTFTVNDLSQYSDWSAGDPLAPTAANVTVSGRVTNSLGRAIYGARVTIFGQNGVPFTSATNPFGYFRIGGIQAGHTYLMRITHKQYRFNDRAVNLNDDLTDVNIVAEP